MGLPPETIKDSMAAGLDVPTLYVLPTELFDRRRGVNVAECEFPAYFNFFALKRKIRLLVTSADIERRVRAVFEEALFGPSVLPSDSEFAADYGLAFRPDFERESNHFRRMPDGKRLDVDTLVEFLRFDEAGRCALSEQCVIAHEADSFVLYESGAEAARVPDRLDLAPRVRPAMGTGAQFEPPEFGVTVLGSSHGFDPAGKTTGFILWVGKRGILVDPPVDTTEYLRERGVSPKLVDGVILTHCHADHDSGTFQKILEEGRIQLYTTPTILGSFLRKYSALSGIGEDLLRRTFVFNPVTIGKPVRAHGSEIWFFYTLHSIPALGFEVFYGGKSMAFSGDCLFDPVRLTALREAGVLTPERCEDLIDFPWHHTVVVHEAGVPPLHTPATVLAELPEDVKERLYVVHIAEKDLPKDRGLKTARVGIEETIRIDVTSSPNDEAAEWLDLLTDVEILRDLPLSRSGELLRAVRAVRAPAGTKVIAEGSLGNTFYVIASGVCRVVQGGVDLKEYEAGDYFGETALVLDQPRTADVIARTDCVLLEIDRYGFLYLLRGTDIEDRLRRLAKMREARSWEVFDRNTVLSVFTSAQKTQLQSHMETRMLSVGEVLWTTGEPAQMAILLDEAQVVMDGSDGPLAPFSTGAFVGDFDAIRQSASAKTTVRVVQAGRAFVVGRDALRRFFKDNPGVLVSFLGARFVE